MAERPGVLPLCFVLGTLGGMAADVISGWRRRGDRSEDGPGLAMPEWRVSIGVR